MDLYTRIQDSIRESVEKGHTVFITPQSSPDYFKELITYFQSLDGWVEGQKKIDLGVLSRDDDEKELSTFLQMADNYAQSQSTSPCAVFVSVLRGRVSGMCIANILYFTPTSSEQR